MPGPRARSQGTAASSRLARLSRLVALVLRHRPEEVGISLDTGGFADIAALARALASQPGWEAISADEIIALAKADPRRYEVREERIRARYGHTVAVEHPGERAVPPEWLYYGTAAGSVGALSRDLHPAGRQ